MLFFVIGLITIAILFHVYFMKIFKYWEKHNIPFYISNPYEEMLRIFLKKSVVFDEIRAMYNGIPNKHVYGVFQFRLPRLLIKDPDILRNICVKNFDHFVNHEDVIFKDDSIFGKSLFALKDEKWKKMRNVLTPVFTSSKLRGLCQLFVDCAQQTVENFIENVNKQQSNRQILKVDVFDSFSKFSNDVIATTAFGVHVNSIKDPTNDFYQAGHEIIKFPIWRFLIIIFCRPLSRILDLRFAPKKCYDFFNNIIKETIHAREEKHIFRYDLVHLLMEARKEQIKYIEEIDRKIDHESKSNLLENVLTDEDFTAQGFIFFLAGYKNVAITLSFAVYELALQPDIQKKVQDEIDKVLEANNGRVDYDILKQMKYLDMVLSETLRKWPPISVIDRKCNKEYKIESENETITVKPGMTVFIPVAGLHRDSKYFPHPNKFDPERFSDVNKSKMNPYTFLPFGIGPRVCIGVRFVMLETKILLLHILSKFDVVVTDKTPIPMVLSPGNVLKPINGFNLGLKLRK